jgi:hypothetical protein
MKQNRNIPGNHLSGRLPVHSPDERLWSGISSGLDNLETQQAYEERLQDLPVHHPDDSTWNLILRRMQRTRIIRISGYSFLAVAASLLLLISIFRIPEAKLDNSQTLSAIGNGKIPDRIEAKRNTPVKTSVRPVNTVPNPVKYNTIGIPLQAFSESKSEGNLMEDATSFNRTSTINDQIKYRPDIHPLAPKINLAYGSVVVSLRRVPITRKQYSEPVPTTQSIAKYYSPDPYSPKKKKSNSFDLAANYLPESLENGNGNSLFHNFGLMASLGNEKTRIQSSVGMTYNSEHRSYDVGYTQYIAITVPNPGHPTDDSTYIIPASGNSKLEGTEKHQYITYDLGVGKKLFSLGKMTTWVNTGAGFAYKLDNSSLKEKTINTIKGHNNSQVNTIDLEIPDYNKLNINIMAGLDFNYLVMDRLIISFAPISRVYLKPVLEKNGSSTDSFSLGFRSGVKFKF